VFCPVLKFWEEKQTFVEVKGDNVDFFQLEMHAALPRLLCMGPVVFDTNALSDLKTY